MVVAPRFGGSLSTEEQAVFDLSVPRDAEDGLGDLRRDTAASSFSWDGALDFARRHRVLAAVAYNLQQDAELESELPDSCRQQLRTSRSFSLVRQMQYVDLLGPVIRTLIEQAIPVALMKGAALIAHTYPTKSRLLNDLDLLIPQTAYDRAAAALETAGFQKQIKFRSEAEQLEQYHQVHFVKQLTGFPLLVDLHWQVYPSERQFHFDTELLFDDASPVEFAEVSLVAMSREDVFVHLATQQINDGFATNLLRLADLTTLIRRGLDWDRVFIRATEAHAVVAVDVALCASQMLGAIVDDHIRQRFQASNHFVCRVASRAITPKWPLNRETELEKHSKELARLLVNRQSLIKAPLRIYGNRRATCGVFHSILSCVKYSAYMLAALLRVLISHPSRRELRGCAGQNEKTQPNAD